MLRPVTGRETSELRFGQFIFLLWYSFLSGYIVFLSILSAETAERLLFERLFSVSFPQAQRVGNPSGKIPDNPE